MTGDELIEKLEAIKTGAISVVDEQVLAGDELALPIGTLWLRGYGDCIKDIKRLLGIAIEE